MTQVNRPVKPEQREQKASTWGQVRSYLAQKKVPQAKIKEMCGDSRKDFSRYQQGENLMREL